MRNAEGDQTEKREVKQEKETLELRAEIRCRMKELRRELAQEDILQRSRAVANILLALPELTNAGLVCMYLSYAKEVDTRWLAERLLAEGKRVAVPKVLGPGQMEFFEIASLNDCEPGAYGILEPSESLPVVIPEKRLQPLMLLPGLAFDRAGGRMGYGGGYYDRYLERYSLFFKVALAYEFSVLEELPTKEYDVPMDAVITENGIIRCSKQENDADIVLDRKTEK